MFRNYWFLSFVNEWTAAHIASLCFFFFFLTLLLVMTQRRQFHNLSSHANSSGMTHERAKKLHDLGLDLTSSSSAVIVSPTQDTRDEAPPAVSDASACTSPTRDTGMTKRKTKAPATTSVPEDHPETRRPPKKRKKSLEVVAQKKTGDDSATEAEERDACAGGGERGDGERQEVSPLVEKEVIKGRGDSAWETLMNVAALVPPLPVAVPTAGTKSVTSSPAQSAKSTPSKKAAKSKYGDLDALPNAGGSYSSKYRAANNDVVPNQQRWEDMFVRLQTYKRIYGHCRVPNRYSDDASLGSWVATQRRYYKNKNLPMPEDRVRRLTDLGFEWTTKGKQAVTDDFFPSACCIYFVEATY